MIMILISVMRLWCRNFTFQLNPVFVDNCTNLKEVDARQNVKVFAHAQTPSCAVLLLSS